MVLIPKGGRVYICIGLVEVIWKVCMSIVNNRLQISITLHDTLHGFSKGGRMKTTIIEAKLAHQLAGIVHEQLFQVFIDVRKSYNSLDRGRCMKILRRYGLRPKLQRLLKQYWGKKGGTESREVFGSLFCMNRGVTQGDPVSLTIFNIVVDAVVRAVLLEVCGPQEAHNGFGWLAGKNNICFYEDDGKIAGCNSIWMQTTLAAMVRMFERVGLPKNSGNTKAMVCTLGYILVEQGAAEYKRQETG